MALLVLLNNFMHDFSAAGWLVGAILLRRALLEEDLDPRSWRLVAGWLETTTLLMRVALYGIVLFGVVRALAYREYEWSDAAGSDQITLLAVKHVLLLGVFLWGLLHYRRARRFLRLGENGPE